MAQPETQRNSQHNTARGKRRKNDPTHAVLRRIRAGKEVRAVDIGRIAEQVDQGVDDGALGASARHSARLDHVEGRVRASTHEEHAHVAGRRAVRANNHDVTDDIYHQRPDDEDGALIRVCGDKGVAEGSDEAEDVDWGGDEERYDVVEPEGFDN